MSKYPYPQMRKPMTFVVNGWLTKLDTPEDAEGVRQFLSFLFLEEGLLFTPDTDFLDYINSKGEWVYNKYEAYLLAGCLRAAMTVPGFNDLYEEAYAQVLSFRQSSTAYADRTPLSVDYILYNATLALKKFMDKPTPLNHAYLSALQGDWLLSRQMNGID